MTSSLRSFLSPLLEQGNIFTGVCQSFCPEGGGWISVGSV